MGRDLLQQLPALAGAELLAERSARSRNASLVLRDFAGRDDLCDPASQIHLARIELAAYCASRCCG